MNIAISGSMQFSQQMFEVAKQLKDLGHKPLLSSFCQGMLGKSDTQIEQLKLHQKFSEDAIREFWPLVQKADAVLVLNYDKNNIKNYIGGNAFLEIGFAHILHKKIFLLNPIPDNPIYQSEIEAMKPIILNGDLQLIN